MDRRLVLRVLAGPNAGAEATLAPRTVIGSGEAADIVVGDPDVRLEHFSIELSGDQATLVVGAGAVIVNGQARTDDRIPLAPFDLVQVGSTICAIGPRQGEWPSLSLRDFVRAQAEPAATVSAVASSGPPAADPTSAPSPSARRPYRRVLAIVSLALLTLVGTAMAVGLHLLQPDENLEESARQQVDAVVASLQMPTVSVAQDETRGVFVEGFVASNEQLALLGRTLAELPFPVKVRVASLEQQATAMRTIAAAHTGANLAIEPNPETGAIRVSGLLPDAGTFATLKKLFERDIANLRPIEEQIVSLDSAAAEVAARLSGAGLDGTTRVDSVDDEIRISGVVPEVARPTFRDIMAKAGQRWSPLVKIVDATTTAPVPPPKVASAQAPMPYEDVAMVVVGKNSFFYDRKGQRHAVGDRLSNGDVIDEISAEEVVIKRGDVRMRYPVTRRY